METKVVKVLDNGRRVVVDLKEKQTAHHNKPISGEKEILLSKRVASHSPPNKVVKKMKMDGSCASQVKFLLLKCYSNYMKTGVPQSVMFYENGAWNNFPPELLTLVKKDLQVKKAAIEVDYNGHSLVLDFLHMLKLDTKTGSSQPMAWIDESGKCFFPEIFSGYGGHQEDLYSGHGYQDIRLQLEIELKEPDRSNGCSGDSNDLVKQIHINEKSAGGRYDLEVEDSCEKPSGFREAKQRENYDVPRIGDGDLGEDDVRKLFFMGMGFSVSADIVDLYRSSSSLMQARLELFQRQAALINKFRGDANVRFAWFPTTKDALPNIMTYGLGQMETSETKSTYGVGVHLSPVNCTYNSASYCDIDENGARHMVFCRIIMGNMELVHEGSKQFYPSGEEFDSGVDDLQNPSHYVVWNMNKSTCIYPEYAVSFKVASDAAGFLANASKLDISGVTACSPEPPNNSLSYVSPAPLIPDEKVQGNVLSVGTSTIRSPKSPWVAFPALLAALSIYLSLEDMKPLHGYYELLRGQKINREDFIRKLRLTVGDPLLRYVITCLQSKENGGNEFYQLSEKVDFAKYKDSKQAARDVEVAVDKVTPELCAKSGCVNRK